MFVYCAENASMPGLVKIGMTDGHLGDRLIQLGTITSVPTPFSCAWYAVSSDPMRDEKALHKALQGCRLSANREFFRCSPGFARSAAESIGLNVLGTEYPSTTSHSLGHQKSEWIGALVFFGLFVVTMPVWGTSIAWYLKPIINCLVPVIIGFSVQGYIMLNDAK